MSDSDPTPEELEAEERRDSAYRLETERKLDEAIQEFAKSKEQGDSHRARRRWDVVSAAVAYAMCNNASYLDPAEGIFRRKFEFYAKEAEQKKSRGV